MGKRAQSCNWCLLCLWLFLCFVFVCCLYLSCCLCVFVVSLFVTVWTGTTTAEALAAVGWKVCVFVICSLSVFRALVTCVGCHYTRLTPLLQNRTLSHCWKQYRTHANTHRLTLEQPNNEFGFSVRTTLPPDSQWVESVADWNEDFVREMQRAAARTLIVNRTRWTCVMWSDSVFQLICVCKSCFRTARVWSARLFELRTQSTNGFHLKSQHHAFASTAITTFTIILTTYTTHIAVIDYSSTICW